jgi:ribosome recycling factor
MLAEFKEIYDKAAVDMDHAVDFFRREISHIRAGKANPTMLEGVRVEYYGSVMPLTQVANISAPEARMLTVQPWDKSMIGPIEKAIMSAGLGFNPQNDGVLIRVPVPMLTEERRLELVKVAREQAERARIGIRNARRDANDHIKKKQKDNSLPEDARFEAESEIQKLTDSEIAKIEEFLQIKEKEITTV